MSFQLLKSEAVPLTPEIALAFRELTPSPTERDLIPQRLAHLRRKADAGKLISFHWAKASLGDQWYRMNGQHSSTVLCELNGGFPQGLYVHIDEYTVDTEADLADLFRQFDDRKSGRSNADVAGAYQGLEPNLREVAKSVAKLGVEAVNWYNQQVIDMPGKRGDDQYSLFHEVTLHEFLKWLNTVFSIKTPELRRKPVVAAMYGTFEKNEEEARKFWDQVAGGGKDYEENAPTTVLDEWLKTSKIEKADLKEGEYFRGCVYAWNAYREDKTIKDIRYDKRKAAQVISD